MTTLKSSILSLMFFAAALGPRLTGQKLRFFFFFSKNVAAGEAKKIGLCLVSLLPRILGSIYPSFTLGFRSTLTKTL